MPDRSPDRKLVYIMYMAISATYISYQFPISTTVCTLCVQVTRIKGIDDTSIF